MEELGLDGTKENIIINVANCQGQFNVNNHGDWFGESGWSGGHNHCSEDIKEHLRWDETHELATNQRPVETFEEHSFS